MAAFRDDAVCIRHWDWSETSQTVSLLGRESGLIRGIAKGAKRENARFSGGLEVLSRGEVLGTSRPTASLATLTAWDLQESFPGLRRSLRAFHCGMYFADLIQNLVSEGDPHPALFDALVESLRALDRTSETERSLLTFQWAVLSEAGFRPELDADVATGEPLPESSIYGFSPTQGGLRRDPAIPPSAPPSQTAPGPHDNTVWRVRGDTVRLLRALSAGTAETVRSAPPDSLDRANRLLASYVREVLGRQPASMIGVFPLATPLPSR